MKRLRRIFFNTLTAISLLLAIATAGLWVRSAYWSESWTKRWYDANEGAQSEFAVYTESGAITFKYLVWQDARIAALLAKQNEPFYARQPNLAETLSSRVIPSGTGFRWLASDASRRGSVLIPYNRRVQMPLWVLLLFFLAAPVSRAYRIMRKHQTHASGDCPACGYDMRANPARCSECGHEAARTTNVRSSNEE